MNVIAENIAHRRKELGMTQKELAEKLNISDKTLSRWETDKQIPDALMIPEIAEALGMSIHELYGIANSEAEPVRVIEKETIDTGKISAYKIALLVGMFLCAIGGWIYFYWLGNYARYGAIILLLIGIMTVLFAEIAYEESCLKTDCAKEYEKIHNQWFGILAPVMGLLIGVIFPAIKPAGMALFHGWDMILPIVLLQLMLFGVYIRNYRRLKNSEEPHKNGILGVCIFASSGVILFLGYTIYSFWNPYMNALSVVNSYDEWVQKGGWFISRMLEIGTGIAFFCMNLAYSRNILEVFKKKDSAMSFKKVFQRAAKILLMAVVIICIVVVPVITTINRTLSRYVSSIAGMVPYEEIMAYEPELIGWIHECNSSGREVNALKRTTYVQGADKFGEAYLFYFPHGGELTETEVTYKIGTAGKILKVKTDNSTRIMGNSYYLCYVEVANELEGSLVLKAYFDGEEVECDVEHTNLQLEVFGD